MTALKVNELSITNNYFATIGSKLASKIDSSYTDSHLRYFTGTDKRFQLRSTSTCLILFELTEIRNMGVK